MNSVPRAFDVVAVARSLTTQGKMIYLLGSGSIVAFAGYKIAEIFSVESTAGTDMGRAGEFFGSALIAGAVAALAGVGLVYLQRVTLKTFSKR